MKVKHANFAGSTSILGYSVHNLSADMNWDLELVPASGLLKITKGVEVCYLSSSRWVSVEMMNVTNVTQGAFEGHLGSSNAAAMANIPEGLYRTTDGELEAPTQAKQIHRARKTPKAQ